MKAALGEIKSIKSKADRGTGPNLDACPNCGQTIPRLWALAGLPPPNGVYQGAGVQNPQNPAWNPAANQGQNPGGVTFNDANGAPIQPGAFTHDGTNWNPA